MRSSGQFEKKQKQEEVQRRKVESEKMMDRIEVYEDRVAFHMVMKCTSTGVEDETVIELPHGEVPDEWITSNYTDEQLVEALGEEWWVAPTRKALKKAIDQDPPSSEFPVIEKETGQLYHTNAVGWEYMFSMSGARVLVGQTLLSSRADISLLTNAGGRIGKAPKSKTERTPQRDPWGNF